MMTSSTEQADRAQEAYLPLLDLCEGSYEQLGKTGEPADRASVLEVLADATEAASGMYEAAFGAVDGQHAVEQALSMKTDARLARLIADAERSRESGLPRTRSGWSEVESHAGGMLAALADPAMADHGKRASMYADLYRALTGVLAGSAAGEILQRLEQSHLDLAGREAADRVA